MCNTHGKFDYFGDEQQSLWSILERGSKSRELSYIGLEIQPEQGTNS
jgi:hypothetical protein